MTPNPYEPQQQPGYSDPSGHQPYAPSDYGQQPGYGQTPGYQQGYGQPYPPVQTNPYMAYRAGLEHPQSTVILVLGILGFFTFVTGIIAWVLGRKALKEMDSSGQFYSNRSQAQIGYVLGIVSSILGGLYVIGIIVYIIVIVVVFAGVLGSTTY